MTSGHLGNYTSLTDVTGKSVVIPVVAQYLLITPVNNLLILCMISEY